MMAANQGYKDIVQILLESGANPDITDKFGKKAYDRAKNQNVFYMLSSAGMERRMAEAHQFSATKPSSRKKAGSLKRSGKKIQSKGELETFLNQFFSKNFDAIEAKYKSLNRQMV